MTYDEVEHLRTHATWTLLRSQHASLVLSFLARAFVDQNAGDIGASELAADLDDELYALNQRLGEERFPRSAGEYLDDWASPERGWLRKFYAPGSDEARFSLTPAVEKAILWLSDLRQRDFIGTESRLNTIFELLRQMVYGASDDPEVQLRELRRRRGEIDAEIGRRERGEAATLTGTALRDRYQLFSRTSRELLADFRELEENFRTLDRTLREQIAGWSGSKRSLLEEALTTRESLAESDQGLSFQAFYDLLLSHQRQSELTDLLERLHALPDFAGEDERMSRIHFDWIDASERTQATVRLLSEQLRRFLDDRAWLENRRVSELIRAIEAKSLQLRDHPLKVLTMELDDTAVSINLPFERPLYRPMSAVAVDSSAAEAGSGDFDSSVLLDQLFVDRDELAQRVWTTLGPRQQVTLSEVVDQRPLDHGLAELMGYLSLGESGLDLVFDDEQRELIGWRDGEMERVADAPRVAYTRRRGREGT